MKNLNSMPSEHISDMVDGQLSDGECAHMLQALLSDPDAAQTWHAYHVVGDVLRSPELAPGRDDFAFLAKLEQRLAQEPVRPGVVETAKVATATPQIASIIPGIAVADAHHLAANAAVFRWKMLAGVACCALVGVLGMNLWTQTAVSPGAQMASRAPEAVTTPLASPVAAPLVVASEDGSNAMIRDPQLDELMAAHRQLGGHSALQVPAGFLRNAAYEGPSR